MILQCNVRGANRLGLDAGRMPPNSAGPATLGCNRANSNPGLDRAASRPAASHHETQAPRMGWLTENSSRYRPTRNGSAVVRSSSRHWSAADLGSRHQHPGDIGHPASVLRGEPRALAGSPPHGGVVAVASGVVLGLWVAAATGVIVWNRDLKARAVAGPLGARAASRMLHPIVAAPPAVLESGVLGHGRILSHCAGCLSPSSELRQSRPVAHDVLWRWGSLSQ